ncbi:hypothetical protein [Nostoc commune]|uniref:hypothetical protein n=1 Tax=Nostoc commune TaxID=1178 RepID=UPI00207445B6|nr:hypothetical protein [Nostoc commune]
MSGGLAIILGASIISAIADSQLHPMVNHITVAGSNRNSGTAHYLIASGEILP